MVRLLAATRLLLERRNFLLATTLASRALATTSSQLQLRPGGATSDDEKTIYFVRHAEGYHNKGERELPNWKTDQLGLDPTWNRRSARETQHVTRSRVITPHPLVCLSTCRAEMCQRVIQRAESV